MERSGVAMDRRHTDHVECSGAPTVVGRIFRLVVAQLEMALVVPESIWSSPAVLVLAELVARWEHMGLQVVETQDQELPQAVVQGTAAVEVARSSMLEGLGVERTDDLAPVHSEVEQTAAADGAA
jgi:hypothetical protein